MYLKSLTDEKTVELLNRPIKIYRRGSDIKFSDRPIGQKFARATYKVFRAFYASVTFYFVPFSVWYFSYMFVQNKLDDD